MPSARMQLSAAEPSVFFLMRMMRSGMAIARVVTRRGDVAFPTACPTASPMTAPTMPPVSAPASAATSKSSRPRAGDAAPHSVNTTPHVAVAHQSAPSTPTRDRRSR